MLDNDLDLRVLDLVSSHTYQIFYLTYLDLSTAVARPSGDTHTVSTSTAVPVDLRSTLVRPQVLHWRKMQLASATAMNSSGLALPRQGDHASQTTHV